MIPVLVHPSQFPNRLRRDLLQSLRRREMNHKFHYDSVKQAAKWLDLHEAFSPARRDRDCLDTYRRSFADTVSLLRGKSVQLISLGCGGGQKDASLLRLLRNRKPTYIASDVSMALTIIARGAAARWTSRVHSLVCDLVNAHDLPRLLYESFPTRSPRLFAFFGLLPNFEPAQILPRVAALLRPNDFLLLSTNLAPGPDYAAGMRKILPQYNNTLTKEWLVTVMQDLGFRCAPPQIGIKVERKGSLMRVVARLKFQKTTSATIGSTRFTFKRNASFRLFFSYRYQADHLPPLLRRYGLAVSKQWITHSGEEGIFLCQRC